MVKYLYVVSAYIKNDDINIFSIFKDQIGVLPVFDDEYSAQKYANTIENAYVLKIKLNDNKSGLHIM